MSFSSKRVCQALSLVLGFMSFGPMERAAEAGPAVATATQHQACPKLALASTGLECGTLTVPLTWRGVGVEKPVADGQQPVGQVTLPYVILKAPKPAKGSKQPAPVVYFEGGPGFQSLGSDYVSLPSFEAVQSGAFPDRDFVLIETRGTGASTPNLDCPEHDDAANRLDLVLPDAGQAPKDAPWPASGGGWDDPLAWASYRTLMACRDRLVAAGLDLTQFNTSNIVGDVLGSLDALGIDRVVALGVSYGGRTAELMARVAPERVEALVVDSPSAWGADFHEVAKSALPQLVAHHKEGCDASVECRLTFQAPLDDVIADAARALQTEPLFVRIERGKHPAGYLPVEGYNFFSILTAVSYTPDAGAQIRTILEAIQARDADALVPIVHELVVNGLYDPHLDEAAYWSAMCSDDRALLARHKVDPALPDYLRDWEAVSLAAYKICGEWPYDPALDGRALDTPVDVPTLVLNFENDVATPASFFERRLALFPNLTRYVFDGSGHAALWWDPCAAQATAVFLGRDVQLGEACPGPFAAER